MTMQRHVLVRRVAVSSAPLAFALILVLALLQAPGCSSSNLTNDGSGEGGHGGTGGQSSGGAGGESGRAGTDGGGDAGTGGAVGGGSGGAAGNAAGGASGGSGGVGGKAAGEGSIGAAGSGGSGASGGAGGNRGFSCGSETCISGESYCFTKYPPPGGVPQGFACLPKPTSCSSRPTCCACVCQGQGDCVGMGNGAPCRCTDTGGEVLVTCQIE
jgi:hypothetical protein